MPNTPTPYDLHPATITVRRIWRERKRAWRAKVRERQLREEAVRLAEETGVLHQLQVRRGVDCRLQCVASRSTKRG